MAENFTADINDLYIIGRMDLPLLGLVYAKVNNAVASTADGEQGAFQTSAGGPASHIAGLWRNARDDLQNILGRNAENLHRAAATVVHIAEVYEQTDTDNGRAILRGHWAPGNTPPNTIAGEHIPTEKPPAIRIAE
jgi:hypothetical protein